MLLALGFLALGAFVVYAGAEAAIRGASGVARAYGVPAFVLGALLFGIDLEGLGTGVAAAARNETAIAAGEIFGTTLFLFSAAFGAALIVSKRPLPSPSTLMVLAPAIPLAATGMVLADRHVARLEGGLLVLLYVLYVAVVILEGTMVRLRGEELEREAGETQPSRWKLFAAIAAGMLLLAAGASLLIAGAGRLADEAELTRGFVGAAILGILVSLDEVILEVLPVRRGMPELATGNLFGTLAAFCSGVLGIAALVRPLDVDSTGGLAFLGTALLYAVVATAFLWRGRASWGVGTFVLVFYAAWLVVAAQA